MSNSWLHDIDFYNYSQVLAQQLQGQVRADWLGFIDPQQVHLLIEGNERQRRDVLRHITGPGSPRILFLPVNMAESHWSLLVVDQHTPQAWHYDSKIRPERAHLATYTAQFERARRVVEALDLRAPISSTPISLQPDDNTCGDHVLRGMETLALRVISGDAFAPEGMDLSHIRPDRQHIIDVLTGFEQFQANIAQPQPPRQVPGGGDQPAPGPYPDISYYAGDDWQHGNQRASPMLINVLENEGLMPSPYVPQTYMNIHGQRYMATLYGKEVWLTRP
ncbi:hypothetical protein AU476_29900 [Cupriavidus sp. UYMSc13B]|nr:hypothetical protein AU476_29900 [Cupriavidus sp. UYMSc13B]